MTTTLARRERPLIVLTRPRAHFDPAEKRDNHGHWSKIDALIGTLKQAGSGGAVQLGDGNYADWSTSLPHGGRRFEIGDRHDAVQLDMSRHDIDQLHGDLTSSLADTRPGGFVFGDGEHDHREISWTPHPGGEDWVLHAIDADGEEVDLDLTYAQMEHLHHGLTVQQLLDAHEHGDLGAANRMAALIVRAGYDETKHKRIPKGQPGGGRFMTMVDRLKEAIKEHHASGADGHPFDGFSREQLRRVAKERGIELKRGESQDSIGRKLMDHLDEKVTAPEPAAVETPTAPVKKPRAPRKKAEPKPEPIAAPAKPTAPPADTGALDERIAGLRARLDALHEEAAPVADALAKHRQGHGITSSQHLQDELKRLAHESDPIAAELLDALIQRDGEPWGGTPETDAERWATPRADLATVIRDGRASPELSRTRDKYVVDDRNTIKQNASLRSGSPTPAAKRWATQVSQMIQASETRSDSLFFRGAAMRPEDVVALHPGAVFEDRGIISTDLKDHTAEFYADTRFERLPGTLKTLFEIRVPKGSAVADVGFGEMVLDRDSRFRVVSSRIVRGPVGMWGDPRKADGGYATMRPESAGVVHVVLELVSEGSTAVQARYRRDAVLNAARVDDAPDPRAADRCAWAPGEFTIAPSDEPDTDEHGPLDEQSAALLVALHRVEDELSGDASNVTVRRLRAHFNPNEARDPHGHWSSLGAHIAHEVHKLGDHELHVEAHHEHTPAGHVTLRHGDRSITLNEREQRNLLRHLHSSDPEVYGSRMTGSAPAPPVHHVLYKIGHGGRDNEGNPTAHTLTVAGHGDDFDTIDHGHSLPLNDKQREHLGNAIARVSEARRIDTGNGPLDMFATPDGHIGLRMSDEHGKPTEATFDGEDWTRIRNGLNVLYEGFDENGKDPYAEVNEMTVKTSHGPVHLRWRGGRDPKGGPTPDTSLTVIPEKGDWSVAVSGSHIGDFLDRAAWLEAATGINQ